MNTLCIPFLRVFAALRLGVRSLPESSLRKGAKPQRRKCEGKNETGAVNCFQFIFLFLFLVSPYLNREAEAQIPLVVPVDGAPFQAKLVDVNAQWKLTFDVAGKPRTIAAADLVAWGHPAELRKGPIIVLADGGRLVANVTDSDKTRLSATSRLLGDLKLPLDSLAGIVYRTPPNAQELDALLERISGGKDRADRAILDNGDEVSGLIETLSGEKLSIKGDLGRVDVAMPRVVAVIFNPALRQPPAAEAGAVWVGLRDGTRLLVSRLELRGEDMQLTEVGGAAWKAKSEDLVFLMPQSDRAVFLSDIRPDEYRFLPYLDVKWPYRTDRNVTGGQLRCGGRLYLKGLGVHSAARLSYKLDRPWSRFQAEIGIDDSTGGRGSVGFRVFVDGKVKYASTPVRGGMAPLPVSVDLTSAKQLDLVVDYGEAGDVLDHADWLNARLVK
jgi:hypothetical protein